MTKLTSKTRASFDLKQGRSQAEMKEIYHHSLKTDSQYQVQFY